MRGRHITIGGKYWLAALLLVTWATASIAANAREAKPPPQREQTNPLFRGPPLVVYLAKGELNSCGPGCSEWIAAEGSFARGSAQRFRDLLKRLRGRSLPVFFQSSGGLVAEAIAIGRFMRERGMTAGVGKTVPRACIGDGAGITDCSALKRTGQTLMSDFSSLDASCSSACVYALVGAKKRRVPPGARLGVHASKPRPTYTDGRIAHGVVLSPTRLAALYKEMRDYLRSMGIADELFQLAASIPHERIGYLSRDQIARFGIDPEPFQESNWTILAKPPAVIKLITETRRPNEIRLSLIRLACAGGNQPQVVYIRGLASDEQRGPASIKLVAPGRDVSFARGSSVTKSDVFDAGGSFDNRGTSAPFELLEAAVAAGTLEIVEFGHESQTPARTVKLSAEGLANALPHLRKECGEAAQHNPTPPPSPLVPVVTWPLRRDATPSMPTTPGSAPLEPKPVRSIPIKPHIDEAFRRGGHGCRDGAGDLITCPSDPITPGTRPADPNPVKPVPAKSIPIKPDKPARTNKTNLYEEDPSNPEGNWYVGSALWRTETVSPGPGQTPRAGHSPGIN